MTKEKVMELVKIKMGTSLFYYIYLFACVGVFLALYFGLRNKSDKFQRRVLLAILFFNFALHFIKQVFPEYIHKDFPAILRKCTPENICAISTMIFPFVYMSNWKTGKDYMFYLGIISGVLGCIAPMPAFGLPFYSLEAIRCYICHASLWQVPLLMVIFGHHKLDYRRIWKALVMYFMVLCVIMVNELILIRLGWVDTKTLFTDEFNNGYFDASSRDMGYAVGLPEGGAIETIGKYVLWMTPKAWKDPYIPILWELFPVIIYGGLGCMALCAYWEHKHMRDDFLLVVGKVKGIIAKWKSKKSDAPQEETQPAAEAVQNNEEVSPVEETLSESEHVFSDTDVQTDEKPTKRKKSTK